MLGFEKGETIGERLTFAEQMERTQERAEQRAERYLQYADNAEQRAESLQSGLNRYRGDIAFFTQPIIIGHSGSQAFSNYRNRLYRQYERGFEEYRKSDYFKERAANSQYTASFGKMESPSYLNNRIKECKKEIRHLGKLMTNAELKLAKIENGETVLTHKGEHDTTESVSERLQNYIERARFYIDKQAYIENKLAELGGAE
ncbi:MAG: DUF3560 domain-containing protein [Firmicutes bacterium]|nr:DUF3560 domain-containing protein [Bacillota bacterium]